MNTLELVRQVVADRMSFKKAGSQIEELPPDKRAATYVIREYRRGNVEGWLAAYLLGCIGDESGHQTVREILLRRDGKGKAGVALAKIQGNEAYEDLLDIMFHGECRPIRTEAAYGVARVASSRTADDFKKAHQQGVLSRSTSAYHIANCRPDDAFLLSLLVSGDVEDRKLALAIIEWLIAEDRRCRAPGKEVVAAVLQVLEVEGVSTMRSRRETLVKWARRER